MPADERLRQPDLADQVGDGRVTSRETLDDPEPVDVGERLVDDAQRAQLVRLVEDRGQRRADPGGGGTQRKSSRARRINGALYQCPLMLGGPNG